MSPAPVHVQALDTPVPAEPACFPLWEVCTPQICGGTAASIPSHSRDVLKVLVSLESLACPPEPRAAPQLPGKGQSWSLEPRAANPLHFPAPSPGSACPKVSLQTLGSSWLCHLILPFMSPSTGAAVRTSLAPAALTPCIVFWLKNPKSALLLTRLGFPPSFWAPAPPSSREPMQGAEKSHTLSCWGWEIPQAPSNPAPASWQECCVAPVQAGAGREYSGHCQRCVCLPPGREGPATNHQLLGEHSTQRFPFRKK